MHCVARVALFLIVIDVISMFLARSKLGYFREATETNFRELTEKVPAADLPQL